MAGRDLRADSIRLTRLFFVAPNAVFILAKRPAFFSGEASEDFLKNIGSPFLWRTADGYISGKQNPFPTILSADAQGSQVGQTTGYRRPASAGIINPDGGPVHHARALHPTLEECMMLSTFEQEI